MNVIFRHWSKLPLQLYHVEAGSRDKKRLKGEKIGPAGAKSRLNGQNFCWLKVARGFAIPHLVKNLAKGAQLRYNAQEWYNNLTLFGMCGVWRREIDNLSYFQARKRKIHGQRLFI